MTLIFQISFRRFNNHFILHRRFDNHNHSRNVENWKTGLVEASSALYVSWALRINFLMDIKIIKINALLAAQESRYKFIELIIIDVLDALLVKWWHLFQSDELSMTPQKKFFKGMLKKYSSLHLYTGHTFHISQWVPETVDSIEPYIYYSFFYTYIPMIKFNL